MGGLDGNGGGMDIETKSASLDTLAVTIQALHVNGKQMTLAVFRQLPVADAYKEDGSLADIEPWGTVRYQIKDEAALWLVASSGGRLYRCAADVPYGRSVINSEQWVSGARDELAAYREWEPKARARAEWDAIPDDERQYPGPPYPNNSNNFRLGVESFYVEQLNEATASLARALVFKRTFGVISALPQLFIAV